MVDRHFTAVARAARLDDPCDMRYPGGKGLTGLAEWIVAQQPPHVFYAEPFAGKAGVFRHKPPALRTWLIDADPDVIAWWQRQRSPGCTAVVGDGIRWLEIATEWAPHDLLVYLDPPYLPEVRTRRRCYRYELTRDQHEQILRAAVRLPCPVMISGYHSELYEQQLAGWRREEREVITRGGVLRTECLWLNPLCTPASSPGVAMQYSDLGTDYRERERVAKRLKRWSAKFRGMDSHERRAVLLTLLAAERDRRQHR